MSIKTNYESPIFSVLCFNSLNIVSCGGGGKKVGMNNRIVTYRKTPPTEVLSNKLFDKDTGNDLFEKFTGNHKKNLIACSSEGFCVVLKPNEENGSIIEIGRFQSDFSDKEAYQNAVCFNFDGNLIATGGDDSLVSASEDQTCRIFNFQKGSLIKKLTFGEKSLGLNYSFASCHFTLDNHLVTIQNPKRGASFFTVWKLNENIDPVKSFKLHKDPVSISCLSKEGLYYGVGTVDGFTKIINLRHLDFESSFQGHDMIVKGIDFTSDSRYMFSGAIDSSYHFLPLMRKEGLLLESN